MVFLDPLPLCPQNQYTVCRQNWGISGPPPPSLRMSYMAAPFGSNGEGRGCIMYKVTYAMVARSLRVSSPICRINVGWEGGTGSGVLRGQTVASCQQYHAM